MNFKRVVTTLILFPLLIFLLFKANIFFLSFLILFTAFLCFYEWKNLYEFPSFLWISGEIFLILGFLAIFKWNIPVFYVFYAFLFFSFVLHLFKYEKERFKKFFFPYLTGIVYIFIGLFPFWEMLVHFKREYLVYFFSVVFANDTGAYLSGKFTGKNPFFVKISPKKTWEGFVGGIIFSVIVAIFLNYYLGLFHEKVNIMIALALSITGSIGDLLESSFKRIADKKDSGKIILGHGGMLDRVDSVLLSSPLFLIILKVFNKV